jgi:hypothetical protein
MIEVVSNANILAKHLIDAGRKKEMNSRMR